MSKDLRFFFTFMSKNSEHSQCEKSQRWYVTCAHIWDKAKILALKEKEKEGSEECTPSDIIDDLVNQKYEAVFGDAQK